MISVELKRSSRSADAIGPRGSRMPSEQPPSDAAQGRKTARRTLCISDPSAALRARSCRDARLDAKLGHERKPKRDKGKCDGVHGRSRKLGDFVCANRTISQPQPVLRLYQ